MKISINISSPKKLMRPFASVSCLDSDFVSAKTLAENWEQSVPVLRSVPEYSESSFGTRDAYLTLLGMTTTTIDLVDGINLFLLDIVHCVK